MILGVHHPAIAVPSMDDALAFYCDGLGFEVGMNVELPSGFEPMSEAFGIENAGCKVCMVSKSGTSLEIFEFSASEPGDSDRPVNRIGITHFALESDDIENDYEHLVSLGVAFNAALFGAAPARFAYGRDPFGNVIELLEKGE